MAVEEVPAESELDVLGPDHRTHLHILHARLLVQLTGSGNRTVLTMVDPATRYLPPGWLERIQRIFCVDEKDSALTVQQDDPGRWPTQEHGRKARSVTVGAKSDHVEAMGIHPKAPVGGQFG